MQTQESVPVELKQGDSVVAGSRRNHFVRPGGVDFGSVLIASFVIVAVAVVCALSSSRFQHWFLIPVSLCGILIGIDAVEWLRGRVDLYDPAGIVGLLGVH